MEIEKYFRCYATVDLDCIYKNIDTMKKRLNRETGIIAVIKTDGYGHGAVPIAKALDDVCEAFAVATVYEGHNLRRHGIDKPIYILGYTAECTYDMLIDEDMLPAIFSLDMACRLSEHAVKSNKTAKINIAVDTGMSRIGYIPGKEAIDEIVHISKFEDLVSIAREVPPQAKKLADAFWPGPLTMIVWKNDRVPYETTGGMDTVAIRMPKHPVALRLIEGSGCLIAAPSANTSGKPSPTEASHVALDMDGRIPMILDGGPVGIGIESTIVDLSEETPMILRPGYITQEMLQEVLGEKVCMDPGIIASDSTRKPKAPGMKYKHYAPKADVTLLNGTFEQFKAYVDAHADQNPSCLCFTGEAEKLGVPCVEYGREGDGADQAKHIFRSLRALDEQGDAVVYARCPQKDGLSMAVYNRLIRAAAFRVIEL